MNAVAQPVINKRIGPIVLAPGVMPIQIAFYIVATMAATFSTAFATLMQPVLLNQQLHVPAGQQGVLTGMLATAQQAAVLLVIGFAGVLADRLGRRVLLMMALIGFTACLWTYPFVSSIAALFVIRFAWGVASTGHTAGGATKLIDYPEERSRGKFISLIAIVYAGAIAVFNGPFASRLPSWLRSAGLTSADATRWSFWLISLFALTGLLVAFVWLAKDRPARPAALLQKKPKRAGLLKPWKEIVSHARQNPRFAVVLLIASVIRTDAAVLMSFLGLWVVQAARQRGIDPIEATKTVGMLLSLGSITQLICSPVFGWLSDRMDRLTILITSLAVVGLAFCSFGLIADVFSPWMIVCVIVVSIAESAQALSANALLGEAAPVHLRGSALGLFTWIGVVSVLLVNMGAGVIFDRVGQAAPFVMEGALCLIVFLVALRLVLRQKSADRIRAAALP
jgi:MFS family permease